MYKLSKHVRKFDIFSVTYSPAISDDMNYNHTSILGGVMSIVLGILSLIYCTYYMYLWWSLQLLPKVTEDVNLFENSRKFSNLTNSVQFQLFDVNGASHIDPFQKDQIIIQPLIYFLEASSDYESMTSKTMNGQLDLNISMDSTTQWILVFTLCKDQYLGENEYCASDERKSQYFQQVGNQIYAQVKFTTINPSTFQPQSFLRTYQIFLDSDAQMCSTVTLHYQMSQYLIKKALLFSTEVEQYLFISDSLNYPTYAMKSFCDQYYLPDTYGAYWIVFQKQYRTISIEYPSVSEVFAAIGSIVSILFSVKYLIRLLNLSQLRKQILDDIMKQYYPEIKSFQIFRNFFGRIKAVKFKGLSIETKSYLTFQNQVHEQLGCKLNYKNLLYEMSRLQFIILSLQRRQQLVKVHNVGIKVPLQLSENGEQYLIQFGYKQNVFQRQKINTSRYDSLVANDAVILSQDYRTFCKFSSTSQQLSSATNKGDYIPEELQEDPDFYDVNQIIEKNECSSEIFRQI